MLSVQEEKKKSKSETDKEIMKMKKRELTSEEKKDAKIVAAFEFLIDFLCFG